MRAPLAHLTAALLGFLACVPAPHPDPRPVQASPAWVPYQPPPVVYEDPPPRQVREYPKTVAVLHEDPLEVRCQDPRRALVRARCRHRGGALHGEPYKAWKDGRLITVQPDDIEILERWDCPSSLPIETLDYARFVMPSLDRDCRSSGFE